jgi:amidase
MARSVADCAVLLNSIVGLDERDVFTLKQPSRVSSIDYTSALSTKALCGARIGVPRAFLRMVEDEVRIAAFNNAIETIKTLGADVVDPADFDDWQTFLAKAVELETTIMTTDFKVNMHELSRFVSKRRIFQPHLEKYLAELLEVPTGVRTMADIIEFNIKNADKELIPPYYADQSKYVLNQDTKSIIRVDSVAKAD